MILKKKGFPEENEIVLCTVTKIQFHSVFVRLEEYERKSGLIHISEISPGRIRNLRDYVKEGKVIVCKVLRVNKERDLIDLSLRRVNENQRRSKINEVKQEQVAEKIIEFVADKQKLDAKKLYLDVFKKIEEEYDFVYSFFEDVIDDEKVLSTLKLKKDIHDLLLETIQQRIKPPEVVIDGKLLAVFYGPEGVEDIKALSKELKTVSDTLDIKFLGGGKYQIVIIDSNYKDAENTLKKVIEKAERFMKKHDGKFEFKRTEHKEKKDK
jgi:translation initiation factor 2 subunit 1